MDWAPRLPSNWKSGRLRWLADIFSGGTPDKSNHSFWEDGTIPWLNSGAVNQVEVTKASAWITEEAFQSSSAKWVEPDSVLVALAGQGKTKGMAAYLHFAATCNQSMSALRCRGGLNARFLFWWLQANYQNLRNMSGGDLRDGLNQRLLGNVECPLPSMEEQAQISAFLDSVSRDSDELIAEQQRLMQLLKEKREALISHAVTKGLNPDAPMKPSGIEWLGDVPAHWTLPPLSLRYAQELGKMLDSAKATGKYFRPYLGNSDLQWDRINTSDLRKMDIPDNEVERYCIKCGDLLICEGGEIGRAAIADSRHEGLGFQKALHRLRPINPESEIVRFLYYTMEFAAKRGVFLVNSNPNTIPHLTGEQLRTYRFPTPPASEQQEIVDHLDAKCTAIRESVANVKRAIDLLLQKRASLISAAVTGKIDVRSHSSAQAVA